MVRVWELSWKECGKCHGKSVGNVMLRMGVMEVSVMRLLSLCSERNDFVSSFYSVETLLKVGVISCSNIAHLISCFWVAKLFYFCICI